MATHFKGKPRQCEVPDALRDAASAAGKAEYARQISLGASSHTSAARIHGSLGRATAAYRARCPAAVMLNAARRRAKDACLDFNIAEDDISIPARCPYLSIPLAVTQYKNNGLGKNQAAPSLDRVDSRLGYVRGNVEVISFRANRIKNDSTYEELSLMGREAIKRLGPEHVRTVVNELLSWLSAEVQSRPDYPKAG